MSEEIHKCSKEELLDRISLVLFGNGHPEDGLAFIIRQYVIRNEQMSQDIGEMKCDIKEAIKASQTVGSALERYRNENETKEQEGVKHQKRTYQKWQLASLIIGIVLALFTIYQGFNSLKKSNEQHYNSLQDEILWKQGINPATRGLSDTLTFKK